MEIIIRENKVYCVHSGLSVSLDTIDQVRTIDRFKEIPDQGGMADMMWAEPIIPDFFKCNSDLTPTARGIGVAFGEDLTARFVQLNNIDHIIRSNTLIQDGFSIFHSGHLSSIFSAPNFLHRCGTISYFIFRHFSHF